MFECNNSIALFNTSIFHCRRSWPAELHMHMPLFVVFYTFSSFCHSCYSKHIFFILSHSSLSLYLYVYIYIHVIPKVIFHLSLKECSEDLERLSNLFERWISGNAHNFSGAKRIKILVFLGVE